MTNRIDLTANLSEFGDLFAFAVSSSFPFNLTELVSRYASNRTGKEFGNVRKGIGSHVNR